MNRRAFIATSAGLLVASWWPRRQPKIDLTAFCEPEVWRYDLRKPFVQDGASGPMLYATNTKVCLRVPDDYLPTDEPDGKLPPASRLPWQDRNSDGWREWPAKAHLLASDTICPVCEGAECICQECAQPYYPDKMCACILADYQRNRIVCPECHGYGHGIFDGLQTVGHNYVSADLDALCRQHLPGLEYRPFDYSFSIPGRTDMGRPLVHKSIALALRFDGGDGLLMTVDHAAALERLQKAR